MPERLTEAASSAEGATEAGTELLLEDRPGILQQQQPQLTQPATTTHPILSRMAAWLTTITAVNW